MEFNFYGVFAAAFSSLFDIIQNLLNPNRLNKTGTPEEKVKKRFYDKDYWIDIVYSYLLAFIWK